MLIAIFEEFRPKIGKNPEFFKLLIFSELKIGLFWTKSFT